MRRLGLLLVAAIALLVAHHAPASATTVLDPIDTSSDTIVGKKFKSPTAFANLYEFTVAENGTLTIDLHLFGKISVDVSLTDESVGPMTPTSKPSKPLSTLSGNPTPNADGIFTYAGLVTGTTYLLAIIGYACSCGGYQATLSLAATPIPAALVMFLTALGGLGFFGWKRNGSLKAVAQAA